MAKCPAMAKCLAMAKFSAMSKLYNYRAYLSVVLLLHIKITKRNHNQKHSMDFKFWFGLILVILLEVFRP